MCPRCGHKYTTTGVHKLTFKGKDYEPMYEQCCRCAFVFHWENLPDGVRPSPIGYVVNIGLPWPFRHVRWVDQGGRL